VKTVISLVALVAAGTALVLGQTNTAQINGVVKDPSGLGIPGAGVKATQTATGLVRAVNTDPDGSFILTNLPIGPYRLEVSKEGFSTFVQSGITLQVDANPTIDPVLKVGATSEQIVVEANATQVETRSTGIGYVVDNQRVLEMPLNGRNPVELVLLNGMASLPGNGAINNVRNYPNVVISVAGGQGGNTIMYTLDGSLHEDPYNNLGLPLPFPDALQEFKLETSALPAQYGYHSGAAVNAVTKSGSNEFHGDLFEFVRNGDLNARDFFAATRDTLKRNQFGGVLGGPIKKDKVFFFGGYQRTTQRSDPVQRQAFVPTAQMLSGDFTAVAAAECQNNRPITLSASQGFAGNRISPARFNPVTLAIQKTMPVSSNPCGLSFYGFVANRDEDLVTGRADWQVSDKHSVFVRYMGAKLSVASTYDGKNPLSISVYGVHDLNYSVAIGDTYVFSSHLVNSLRLGASRTNVVKSEDPYKSLRDFGANITPVGGSVIFTTVTGGGGFVIGSTAAVPGEAHTGANPTITDDVSWVKGSHQFVFGGNAYKRIMNYWSGVNAVGSSLFNGTVTGLGMADFLVGNAVSFSQGVNYGMYLYQYYGSLYANDTWKATSRLTVSYGVRWEPYLSNRNKYGQLNHFDPGLYAQGYRSKTFVNAPVGLAFAGDPEYNCGNGYNCNTWAKFFPRVGLVWDPTGSGKMTIRASYGMFGDRLHQFFPNQMGFGPPFGNNVGLSNVNIQNPWADYPGGNAIPRLAVDSAIGHASPNSIFPTFGQYVTFNLSDYKPMYSHQWNFSLQRQVGEWLLTLDYLGNSSIHLGTSEPLNPAVFLGLGACTLPTVNTAGQLGSTNYPTCSTTGNQNQRRVFYRQNPTAGQYYAGIGQYDPGGTGEYNGLHLAAQKRLSQHYTVTANYTWAHCISDFYDQQTGSGGVAPYQNRRAARANCPGDQRQQFVLNFVAVAPRFQNKWMRAVASDWQVAPILQLRTGNYFSVVPGTDRTLTTEPAQTGNYAGGDPYAPPTAGCSPAPCVPWLNTGSFTIPALGTRGNLGLSNIRGPGVIQLNMAISRTFPLWGERRNLQVRAEAFNLPNHMNPDNPSGSLASSTFGQVTGDISGNSGFDAGNPRILQIAMKFVF
jgi:hypothetical protein